MFKAEKILCPVDFSDRSHKALRVASDLAVHFACDLFLVHVVQEIPALAAATHAGVGFNVEQYRQHLTAQSEDAMRQAIAEHTARELRVEHSIKYGDPAREILAEATERGADLLVIASHGWSVLDELFFGSVAEKLLKHSTLPVFVVPANK